MLKSKKEKEETKVAKKLQNSSKKAINKKSSKKKTKKISEKLIKKADLVNRTIIAPIVSEDAMKKTTVGKYVFKVNPQANKRKVAEAIEVLYGVDVVKVNMMKYKQENHRFRFTQGKRSGYKKAIVTVKSGQEIQLFSE